MYLSTIVPLVALATTVVADGFLHFDVEKRSVPGSAARLRKRQSSGDFIAPIQQNPNNDEEYIISIAVGTPGQKLSVTLDTGSSDLWIPSASFCQSHKCDFGGFDPTQSSTYQDIDPNDFNITYAAPGDSDAGDWSQDTVQIGTSSAIKNQIFGLSNNGYDLHGVMGIGFDTHETTAPGGNSTYPTVVDNMVTNGLINRKAYSLYLNALNESGGSIVFGGIDTTKYTGNLVALPLQPGPGGEGTVEFFVTLTQVTFTDAVGTQTVLTPDGYAQAVLLDSGTSYTALSDDVAAKLATGMGAVAVDNQGDLAVPCSYNKTNATISYTFGGDGGPTVVVPISQTLGQSVGNECDFGFGGAIGGVSILGDTFLRSAYVVFDLDNKVAALGQAAEGQEGTSSIVAIPSGTELPGVSSTATATATQLSGVAATASPTFATASYGKHSSIIAGTPTFNLGAAATSGVSSSNAAAMPTITGLSHVALMGAGFIAGAFVL